MRNNKKKSTLVRYLVTYMSVVLVACIAVGEVMCWRSVTELNQLNRKKAEERIALALDELEEQCSTMLAVGNSIASSIIYRPIYVESNKYYDLERIADFKKYLSYSTLISDLFLLYDGTGEVYTTTGKITLDLLAYILGIQSARLSPEGLNRKDLFVIPELHPTADRAYQEGILFVVTSHLSGIPGSKGNFSVLFVVQHQRLKERLEQISGLAENQYDLFYQGVSLWGPSEEREGTCVSSSPGNFTVRLYGETGYEGVSGFLRAMLLMGIGLTVLMLLLGVLAAYSMYRPIQKVADRIGGEQEKDKLQSIATMISNLEKENQIARINLGERLDEIESQRRQMRQQLVNLLFNGVWTEEMEHQIETAQMDLRHAYYAALIFKWPESFGKDTLWLEQLTESMQDEEISLYGARHKHREEYWLLINADTPEKFRETVDILQECLESKSIPAAIQMGQICHERSQLPISLASIHAVETGETAVLDQTHAQNDLAALTAELQSGRLEEAMQIVQYMEMRFKNTDSLLMRNMHRLDILHILMEQAKLNHMTLSEELMERMLRDEDDALYKQDCYTLMNALCTQRLQNLEDAEASEAQTVLEYIRDHLTDPNLTITETAEYFGKNSRQMGKIIFKYTNLSYKEYVTKCKIDYAKHLLIEKEKNVDETSSLLCYANAAYFIKVFKAETGLTPGQFKKLVESNRTVKI